MINVIRPKINKTGWATKILWKFSFSLQTIEHEWSMVNENWGILSQKMTTCFFLVKYADIIRPLIWWSICLKDSWRCHENSKKTSPLQNSAVGVVIYPPRDVMTPSRDHLDAEGEASFLWWMEDSMGLFDEGSLNHPFYKLEQQMLRFMIWSDENIPKRMPRWWQPEIRTFHQLICEIISFIYRKLHACLVVSQISEPSTSSALFGLVIF